MRAFVTCDGEQKQIAVFQEEDLITLFKDALIDFGKTPASCSAICQSSDASPFFKATKKKLRSAAELGESVYGSRTLKMNLQERLNEITSFTVQKKRSCCRRIT